MTGRSRVAVPHLRKYREVLRLVVNSPDGSSGRTRVVRGYVLVDVLQPALRLVGPVWLHLRAVSPIARVSFPHTPSFDPLWGLR